MKKLLILTALILSSAVLPARASVLVVYHTSDVHGSYATHKAGAAFGADSAKMIGGYPVLVSLVKQEKNPYILLDSGDIFQGTPEGVASRGMASVDFMNLAGYSAVAVGNHDFDYGSDVFKKIALKLKAGMLSANLTFSPELKKKPDYVKPYIILNKAGRKIAVIGLSNKITTEAGHDLGKEIQGFEDEAFTVVEIVKKVRDAENPDYVILLNHNGTFGDVFGGRIIDAAKEKISDGNPGYTGIEMARLAREIDGKGVDLVLSGHEHTGLLNGYYDKESGTWFSESGTKLNYVSRIEIHFNDKTGMPEKTKIKLIPLWAEKYGEDARALKLVRKYSALVQKQMSRVVGKTAEGINAGDSILDNPLAQWTCLITGAEAGGEISTQNSSSFSVGLPAGNVTLKDLYKSMKFDNTLYRIQMPGKGIIELVKDNFKENDKTTVYFSGIEVEYTKGKKGPENIKVLREGKPLNPERIYTVISNDYFVNVCKTGGAFKRTAVKIENTGFGVRETMQKHLEATLKAAPLQSNWPSAYRAR